MTTMLEPPAAPPPAERPEIDVHSFEHHWQDEADAAYLYRILAAAEPDPKKKDIYSRLADVEDRHVVVWSDLLAKHGHQPGKFRPSGRARLLATFGRWFGPDFLLPMLLEEEGREVKAYLDMHRETPRGSPGGAEALARALASARGQGISRRPRPSSRGSRTQSMNRSKPIARSATIPGVRRCAPGAPPATWRSSSKAPRSDHSVTSPMKTPAPPIPKPTGLPRGLSRRFDRRKDDRMSIRRVIGGIALAGRGRACRSGDQSPLADQRPAGRRVALHFFSHPSLTLQLLQMRLHRHGGDAV